MSELFEKLKSLFTENKLKINVAYYIIDLTLLHRQLI